MKDFPHHVVCAAADALLIAQTGACRFGKVCRLCDCPASYNEEWMRSRDGYAYEHSLVVLRAAEGAVQ